MATNYTLIDNKQHGYIVVKRSELVELGISEKISMFSFMKDDDVYVEQNNDMTLYLETKFKTNEEIREFMNTCVTVEYVDYTHFDSFERYMTPKRIEYFDDLRKHLLEDYEWSEEEIYNIKTAIPLNLQVHAELSGKYNDLKKNYPALFENK